ncbi:hypothetical protein ACFQU7_26470 [Pseudoroseomonas wenyumeiae]
MARASTLGRLDKPLEQKGVLAGVPAFCAMADTPGLLTNFDPDIFVPQPS